ncbi:DUF3251 domain-containing protein [Candidatus Omnitrophota bacterium]
MIHLIFVFLIVPGILSLQGCSREDITQPQYQQLQQRIDGLEQRIERRHYKNVEFQMNVQRHITQLAQLAQRGKISPLEKDVSPYKAIMIDPAEKGFQKIETATGYFLVACESVNPHSDGYKLTLIIGNPAAVTYSGFALRVTWGEKFDEKSAKFEEWKNSLKEKKHLFASNILRPGAWSRVELDLSPATPEELGFIQLAMATGSITFGTVAPDNPQAPETTEEE